jgi:crotonobetainyl-CoA hydratase
VSFDVAHRDGIATVTIDRPKANAIDAATSRALGDAFAALDADPDVRVVIITGAGERFFSAGWDLSADESFDSEYGVGGFGGFVDLADRRTPVIAALNGMAVGGGFEIAMAADLMIAADHVQCWLPETALGMLPDAGSVRLPRLLPHVVANEVLFGGRRLDAAELVRWGIANAAVPAAQLADAAVELAARVAAAAPLSIAAVLDIDRRTGHLTVAEAMAELRDLPSYRAAIDSDDAREGVAAFGERRPPTWRGR